MRATAGLGERDVTGYFFHVTRSTKEQSDPSALVNVLASKRDLVCPPSLALSFLVFCFVCLFLVSWLLRRITRKRTTVRCDAEMPLIVFLFFSFHMCAD